MASIAVIAYSTYGHANTLAESIVKGIEASGAKATLYQFEETLSAEVLVKMYAAPKAAYPVIKASHRSFASARPPGISAERALAARPDDLKNYDGFLMVFGTRYGRAPAQVSTFFDQTGGLWASGALVGKLGAFATGAAGQHGGHETTILSSISFLAHHGVIYCPLGYGCPTLSEEGEIIGGSAWGASYVAGATGALPVTDKDKLIGEFQGKSFGDVANALVRGRALSQ